MFKVTVTEKIVLTLMFILVITGVMMSRINLSYFEGVYVREDGVIEWLTVFALFCGAILSIIRVIRIRLTRGIWFLLVLIGMTFLFLFGIGEEISWGQRLFDIQSSEFFFRFNSQGETNFHNLVFQGKKLNKIIFGTGLGICVVIYFLILPVLYHFVQPVRRFINSFAIPLPKLVHTISYIFLAIICAFTIAGKKGELMEFGGCWIFFLMTLYPVNRRIFSPK